MQVSVHKKLILQALKTLKEKKHTKTKAIQLKKEIEKNKTKINGLNCFARAANKFGSEFMDKKYGNACVWMQHQRILFVMITNSD